jgi:uncharacterized protein (TIGR03435 family)
MRNLKLVLCTAALLLASTFTHAQTPPRPKFDAFEVATIKLANDDEHGRYIKIQDVNHFVARDYTLKLLIAAAYDLNPKTIFGGEGWVDSRHFDLDARTPGDIRPTHDEQMRMLRALLVERFGLTFHRDPREFSIYAIEIAKGGPKLKPTTDPNQPPVMGPGVVFPQRLTLPARNASIGDLASLLQRAVLDRPVVDRTNLTGRYDFDLEWAPDESQFGGDVASASDTAPALPLFEAIQKQLGLRLNPTRGSVDSLVIDAAHVPSGN